MRLRETLSSLLSVLVFGVCMFSLCFLMGSPASSHTPEICM